MPSFRFVHAADLHLDTPFDGLSRLGTEVPALLRDASLRAFDNLVQLTLEEGAHALILAGDIYDGPERGLRAQLRFHAGLKRLSDAGVHVVMVHGNHDPVAEGWSAIRDWPERVTVLPAEQVASVPVLADGREVARVYGISYAKRETTANLAEHFPRQTADGFAIGVLHCNAGGNAEHANYSPCSLDDLRAADIDYWALGHIHRHQVLADGAPWIVYPGVLQGRSPKPSERGAKGAVVVDVADDRIQHVDFRPLDVVRFAAIEVDIAGIADAGGLQRHLAETTDAAVDAAEGRQLILRATLTGRGPVHGVLRAGEDADDELLAALQADAGDRVWWDRLVDRTAPPVDPDAIRRRGDFAAELLQRADALAEDDAARSAFLARHARAADRRLKGIVDAQDEGDAHALLDAAVAEALDRLEPGEPE